MKIDVLKLNNLIKMSTEKNLIDAKENPVATNELNTQEKVQEVSIDQKVDIKQNEKPEEKKADQKEKEKVDIKNILNLDEMQYNSLLEVLIQDTKFTEKFLERAQQNFVGQKKGRDEKNEESKKITIQYDDSPKIEIVEERDDLNQEEYNVNDIMLAEGPEEQEIYVDDKYKNKDSDDEIERDKILEEDIYYNRLLKLVKQYKLNKVFNVTIDIIRNSGIKYKNMDEDYIKKEIIDITKTIKKEIFIIYLMKIMLNNSNKEQLQKLPSPKKFKKKLYMEQTPKTYNNNEYVNDEYGNNEYSNNVFANNDYTKKKFGHSGVPKKKKPEPDYQYRGKHFVWKNGILYCFFPKNRTNSSNYTLYCSKRSCNARLKIDLKMKKIIFIGNHTNHEGINIEKLKWEYPEIVKKDWKHLQYDCFHGKKILVWKF